MGGLVTFQKSRLEQLDDEKALQELLNGMEVNEAALLSLIEECQSISIETPPDILVFYQKLLSLLFILRFCDIQSRTIDLHVQELLKKGKNEGYWESYQLPLAYAALASHLLTEEPVQLNIKQLEKGGVLLENGHHFLEGQVVKLVESVHLALLWIYLGWSSGEANIFNAGLKLSGFCRNLCDKEGRPFHGLWMKEHEYQPEALLLPFSLLFSVAKHLSLSCKTSMEREGFWEKQGLLRWDASNRWIGGLARGFEKLIERQTPLPDEYVEPIVHTIDSSLGFIRYDYESLNLVCSACGVNTGLGAIHKKGVRIVSFGPHYYPLADSDCFGIYRPSNGSTEGFKDLIMESEENRCRFKGWSRIMSRKSEEPGNQWIFFDIHAQEEFLDIDVRLSQCLDTTPLAFAFFISAQKVCIGKEQTLRPGSIERYQGESTTLVFEKDQEFLTLISQYPGDMQVIPLAGKRHFWSADFLIAFPIKEKLKPLSWKVE